MSGLTGEEKLLGVQGTSTETLPLSTLADYLVINSNGVTAEQLDVVLADRIRDSDLAAETGAAMVGLGDTNLGVLLADARVPIEKFGAVGNYDPVTKTGTDCTAAFNAAAASGKKIQLRPGAKYMISDDIVVVSGTDFYGDDTYSPCIYPKKAGSNLKMIRTPTPLSTPVQKNVSLRGFTVARIGDGAEHGVILDNIDGLKLDLRVISDGNAHGGAVGIGVFQPYHRKVSNFEVRVECINSGDFGLEIGHAEHGVVDLIAEDCYREVLGIEPTCTRQVVVPAANVAGNVITAAAHGLTTGQPVVYDRRGNAAALPDTAYWFVIRLTADTFSLARTRAEALAGAAYTIGAVSGTHYLYVCNVVDNVTVRTCIIKDRKSIRPPSFANTTGYVILTGNSGGWIGNVSIPAVHIEGYRAETDVLTSGIRMQGTRGTQVGIATVEGCDDAVQFRNGTLNGMRDEAGAAIGDSVNFPVVVTANDNVIGDLRATGFKRYGINPIDGKNYVKSGALTSYVAAATGISVAPTVTAEPEFSNLDVRVPNGLPWDAVPHGRNNRDLVNGGTYSRDSLYNYAGAVLKQAKSGDNVCMLKAGTNSTYMGRLDITVRTNGFGDANMARYVIDVTRAFVGATPTLTLVNSYGLTSGATTTLRATRSRSSTATSWRLKARVTTTRRFATSTSGSPAAFISP